MFGAEGGHGEAVVQPVLHHITWWQNGGVDFGVGIRMDGLAVMMLFVVTLISLLVHVYSTAYMHDDVRFTYYYAMLSLFTAAMLLLVVADNTLQLLVGWEGVGPLLVRPDRALVGGAGEHDAAALKAFLTTRTGDIGLMIGDHHPRSSRSAASTSAAINAYALSGGADHQMLARRPRVLPASSGSSARAVSSRSTPGCPTPWPVPPRCRR